MKNTEVTDQARQIIASVRSELDPDLLKSRFDDPIARAARQFEYYAEAPVPHRMFQKIIAGFVEHVYEQALGASWLLSDALAEAILLLDRYYSSVKYGTGYMAAFLDAGDEATGGIETVLAGLSDAIKDMEREKHINGVLSWHVRSAGWTVRCEIARIILEDYGSFLAEHVRSCAPAQLVDEIPSIIRASIYSDSTLRQICFNTHAAVTAETPVLPKPL